MRVLMLTTDLRLGGAERAIINTVQCLRQMGITCAVAGLFEGTEGRGKARRVLEAEGFPVFCARMDRPRDAWRLWRLRRFVVDWAPDLIHAHLFHGHLAAATLALTGVRAPSVWSYHAIAPRRWPLRRAFYRLLKGLGGTHVYVSAAVRRYQRRTAGAAVRERVIHNGIELAPFLDVRPVPGSVFGAVGRLVPEHKGFDVLIRAFARLACHDAEPRLKIAGDGPRRAALERLAREERVAERVDFAGFVDDVAGFLAEVNVFVNPSRWEAFGTTLVEGMAAGLPCIGSRVHGLSEIGGRFVRWVRPGDVDGLHRAMRELVRVERPAGEVAEQRDYVGRRFSRERLARDYLETYLSERAGR